MKMTIKDSRGKDSTTLFFVTVGFSVVMAKFIAGGLAISHLVGGTFQIIWNVPVMGGTEFGIALGAVLAAWTAREHKEKSNGNMG